MNMIVTIAKRLIAPALALMLVGCAQPKAPKDYTALRHADPHSILIVPAINQSVYVNAPDYYLSTITRPLAERGYYVFPVHMVKRTLEDDGLSDADMVHRADPRKLGALFGADAILYVTINRWDSQYLVVQTTTTVDISYRLVDAKSGEVLWNEQQQMAYSPNSGGGGGLVGLVAKAIVAAIEKADPNYMMLARLANAVSVYTAHQGLPAGPHHDKYQKDAENF
jgi:hypothetical protein